MSQPGKQTKSQRRQPLERRVIAEKALELIDSDGLETLSMRRLGTALGVEAMTLYHHFRNKAELLDGVLELLVEEMEAGLVENDLPLERLRRVFENIRQIAIRHPPAYVLAATRRFRTPATLAFYERLLQIFRDAGFNAEASARYFRVLVGFVNGAGLAEVGSRGLQPDATAIILEDFSDSENFPRVTEVVPHLRVTKLDRIFAFGLDLIFSAMETELRGPGETASK
jgi:TetR/AcrR family transcriptional regulator, tetracycline repressor protein